MRDQRRAGGLAEAGDDVDDAGRQADVLKASGQLEHREAASARPASARTVQPAASAGASFHAAISSG